MVKWHGYGRCKTRLSKHIGKLNSLSIQRKMTHHTLSVAKFLEEKGLIDISLAISGVGLKKGRRWSKDLGVKKFNLQGKGSLGEKMKRQIIFNKKLRPYKNIKNIIIVGTDLPNLCHLDLLNTITKLKKNDVVLGPSTDGGYWLIAFSMKLLDDSLYLPFIDIEWSKKSVLKKTISNLSSKEFKYDLLQRKIDIDTIKDIEKIEYLNCQKSQ